MSYINSGDVSKRDQPDSYQPVHSGGSGSSLTTVLKTCANAWGMTDVRQKLPSWKVRMDEEGELLLWGCVGMLFELTDAETQSVLKSVY